MDRASDFGSEGSGFDPWLGRLFLMINPKDKEIILLLTDRLERISVDSYWAHRASGIRGTLLRMQEAITIGHSIDEIAVDRVIASAFLILNKAAKEKR